MTHKPIMNMALKDLMDGLITMVGTLDSSLGVRFKSKSGSSKIQYQKDQDEAGTTFPRYPTAASTVHEEDGVEAVRRCSRCLWEVHGRICDHCGATVADHGGSSDSEGEGSMLDSESMDDSRVIGENSYFDPDDDDGFVDDRSLGEILEESEEGSSESEDEEQERPRRPNSNSSGNSHNRRRNFVSISADEDDDDEDVEDNEPMYSVNNTRRRRIVDEEDEEEDEEEDQDENSSDSGSDIFSGARPSRYDNVTEMDQGHNDDDDDDLDSDIEIMEQNHHDSHRRIHQDYHREHSVEELSSDEEEDGYY